MEQHAKRDTALLFCISALLLAGALAILLFPAPRFSARENRLLEDKPTFTLDALKSGALATRLDHYATERFPARNGLRSLAALTELALGKREVNGVIFCRDRSLARHTEVKDAAYQKNLRALQKLLSKRATGQACHVGVIPRRIEGRAQVLPAHYKGTREQEIYRTLQVALPDAHLFEGLTGENDWFCTDHHLTASGAFSVYCALGEMLGYTPIPREEFHAVTVSESFYGTSYAAAGIPTAPPDRITLLRHALDTELCLKRDGQAVSFRGVYDLEKACGNDGYAVFLGGNAAIVEITREEEDSRPTLLIIKDSFGNAIIPFLAQHYRILAADPRYCDRKTLLALTETADTCLVLCGIQTLCGGSFL